MRPILDHLETIGDVGWTTVGRFAPPNNDHFAVNVIAGIGSAEGPGREPFRFVACSPGWMENEVASGEYYGLRHYLLLSRWDYDLVVKAGTKLCTGIKGSDWMTVVSKLGRDMHRELKEVDEP